MILKLSTINRFVSISVFNSTGSLFINLFPPEFAAYMVRIVVFLLTCSLDYGEVAPHLSPLISLHSKFILSDPRVGIAICFLVPFDWSIFALPFTLR